MEPNTITKAVRFAETGDTIFTTTFTIDMNKPGYQATDRMSTGGTDWVYFHPWGTLPEAGGYDQFKSAVMDRCVPVNWDEPLNPIYQTRGVWMSRRLVAGGKVVGNPAKWSSMYDELGPMASLVDLVLYLARVYGQDPRLRSVGVDFQTEIACSWQDKEGFEYVLQSTLNHMGEQGRRERIDPERYV